ncbi:MAG: SusC/RagA family TonB-linked outer membrane protein [Odoribacteraceae bacterium]|jgi:TonB-linked SusC/RagA family outer membrane protein|nr:SusC/RagA family TonB-linked outer membrane protein [Odoribacteraceae bacterium]
MKKMKPSRRGVKKFPRGNKILIMKMVVFFTCCFVFNLSAAVNAQRVTLKTREASLVEVMRELKRQTGREFFYSHEALRAGQPVDLEVREMALEEVLRLVLGNAFAWEYVDEMVVIRPVRPIAASGQQRPDGKISGQVTDEAGEPLVGVSILVKGTTRGVTTDADGKFTLDELSGSSVVLRVSFVGKETREVEVKIGGRVEVVLKEAVAEVEQVVVTGYQTIAREQSTGAVTTISAASLEDRYTPSLRNNLEGRVAGLTIYDGKMTIRGASSLYAATAPLLVVDGLPVEGSLEDINPYDVERVTVLKDASATAIYGARASNGIIVITTKKAREQGRISVDVSANFTVYQKRNLDYARNFYMTPEQQVKTEMDYYHYYFFDNDGEVTDPIGTTENSINTYRAITPVQYAYYQLAKGEITEAELERQMAELKKNNFAKEYAKHVLLNRFLQQYNVAIRSLSERFQSNLVVNYRHDNTGIRKAGNNQLTIFYKGAYDLTPWLTASYSVNSILGKSTRSNSQFATDPFSVPAYYRLLEDNGEYAFYSPGVYYSIYNPMPDEVPALRSMHFNHLEELSYDQEKSDRRGARYHGELLFRVLPGLTANTRFIYETERQTTTAYAEAESYIMRLARNVYTVREGTAPDYTYRYMIPENGGKLATVNTRAENWTARGQVNFSRAFDKHAVNLIAGMEFRETKNRGTRGLLLGYDEQLQSHATTSVDLPELNKYEYSTFFALGFPARQVIYSAHIASAIGPVVEQLHRYASGYANATYTYANRYNVFGSLRKDYADVYGLDTKFRGKPLWSVGANWNIHNETFLEGIKAVDFLQFRLSYGITGNIYQGATSHMTATSSFFNSVTKLPMSIVDSPANPELKWEETATTNVGMDFRLFGHRLRGGIDYYHKKGTDIFSHKTLDPSKGFTSLAMNLASLKNNGVELTLGYDWLNNKTPGAFRWNTQLTASYNKNEITRVEVQANRAYGLVSLPFQVGYPVSALFSYRFAGTNDQGQPTWYAADGSPVTDARGTEIDALVYSGQQDPKTVLSMENQFKYKGISLNVLMVYYGGHKMRVLQANPMSSGLTGMPYGLIPSYFLNAWTPENTDTNVPGIGRYAPTNDGGETTYTDIYVQPADFLKIRNVVLAYELPSLLLSKIGLREATVRFQVDNPKYLWVKNKVGVDPETRSLRSPSSYIFGINFNF